LGLTKLLSIRKGHQERLDYPVNGRGMDKGPLIAGRQKVPAFEKGAPALSEGKAG